jgi:hypothetical protein
VFGRVVVTNTTTGPSDPGPAFVYVRVDSGPQISLPLKTTITLDSLPAGGVSLGVDLLRPWCTLPQDPLSVEVRAGDTTRVKLAITCEKPPGAVFVRSTTTGPAIPGPSSIFVTIGARRQVELPLDVAVTIDSLPIGAGSLVVDLLRD